jgi:hypothetical protein
MPVPMVRTSNDSVNSSVDGIQRAETLRLGDERLVVPADGQDSIGIVEGGNIGDIAITGNTADCGIDLIAIKEDHRVTRQGESLRTLCLVNENQRHPQK